MKAILALTLLSLTGCSYFTDHPQIQATATKVGKHLAYEAKQEVEREAVSWLRSYFMGL